MTLIDQVQTLEFWVHFIEQFKDIGPLAPIFLAMIESFVPPLPLLVIVGFNASVYGFVWGALYSYIGVALGSYLVFMFFRTIIKGYFIEHFYHGQRFQKILAWVERQPSFFLFVISAIPFTPSSFVNIAFGLSGYRKRQFFLSVLSGKIIAINLMAFFGHSLRNLSQQPFTFVLSLIIIVGAYGLAQRFQKDTKIEND